jgi:hypothetical protein
MRTGGLLLKEDGFSLLRIPGSLEPDIETKPNISHHDAMKKFPKKFSRFND